MPASRFILRMLFCLFVMLPGMAHAGDSYKSPSQYPVTEDDGHLSIIEENDLFASGDDRHYTQGAKISYVTGPVAQGSDWMGPFDWFSANLPIFDGNDRKRKYQWNVGQSIFTPTNLLTSTPSPRDRPYAAWLYTGVNFLQESNHESHSTLENLELLMGVVGPAALGGLTQNDFHQFIGIHSALGWQNELHNEPGVILTYERKWRFGQDFGSHWAVDAIPEAGFSGGNILTYGQIGAMFRIGQNIAADYGPDRIRPSLSGTGWFNPDKLNDDFGWYLFAGTQGRAIGHNIFLDGNSYAPSSSVDRKPLVADLTAGASVFWAQRARIDFTVTQRTYEFYGQSGHPDRFGSVHLSFGI